MKRIFKNLGLITVFVSIFVLSLNATEVVITNLKGNVKVWSEKSNWIKATIGLKLTENNKLMIKKGYAELVFYNGTVLKVKENTEIDFSKLIGSEIKIGISRGKIFSKVIPFKENQHLTIITPTAIASIRGTEFIMEVDENNTSLAVLSGKVEFGFIRDEQLLNVIEVNEMERCSIDVSGKIGEKQTINEFEINNLQKEFNIKKLEKTKIEENIENTETDKESVKKEELNVLRNELKNFINETKIDAITTRDIVQQVQEADFSAGRSLIDIHGNLVRTEQMLLRPDPYSVQFLNLTKRSNYNYNGKFSYNGYNGARLDYIDANITFSEKLPQDITEFPGFFSDRGDNIYVKSTKLIIGNDFNKNKDSFVFESNVRNNKDEELKITPYITNGTEKWIIDEDAKINEDGPQGKWRIIDNKGEEKLVPKGLSEDGLKYTDERKEEIIENQSFLWGIGESAIPVKSQDNTKTDVLWLQTELYLLNNNGNILRTDFYKTMTFSNPLDLLKEIAFESILSVKRMEQTDLTNEYGKSVPVYDKTSQDFLSNKNIDIVQTPDIIVTLVKQLAPTLSNLSNIELTNNK